MYIQKNLYEAKKIILLMVPNRFQISQQSNALVIDSKNRYLCIPTHSISYFIQFSYLSQVTLVAEVSVLLTNGNIYQLF